VQGRAIGDATILQAPTFDQEPRAAACRDSHSLGLQVQVHLAQDLFAQLVFF
jgi:hypothetical protein